MTAMDGWIEIFSLAWAVPLVLDAMMSVAMAVYDYFVGPMGGGVIYMMVWGFLALSTGLYLIKMYFPKPWLAFFNLSGGGEMYDPKTDGMSVARDVVKPMIRAVFAIMVLLQIKPVYVTEFVVNPFLEFGAVYVDAITSTVLPAPSAPSAECPESLGAYLSKNSCEFLVKPIDDISRVNNKMIKRGFDFLYLGFAQGLAFGFMNIVTGILLIAVFFSSNLFMAMLILQGIFKFGFALILYPFKVLAYVAKDAGDMLVNPWPSLSGIVKALQTLVIAMIAVAFILLVNVSIAGALFNLDPVAYQSFGGHSVTWLTAILTFWIMFKVFDLTREQLGKYVSDGDMMGFYDKVAKDVKAGIGSTVSFGKKAIDVIKNAGKK